MSRVHSPHVVQYFDSGLSKKKDVFWIVMEHLDGISLDRELENRGPLPEVEVIKVQ